MKFRTSARKKEFLKLSLLIVISIFLSLNLSKIVRANSVQNPPQELIEVIAKIDLAASNGNLERLQEYFARNFTTKDGLNYELLGKSLTALRQKYSDLKYKTTLKSWEQKDNQIVAETLTEINGIYNSDGRKINLSSTIRSLQYFDKGKLIRQDILSERTDLTSGENPPEVEVKLPEMVKPGEQFNFDVIVQQPLGYDLLLGAAIEEKISPDLYLNPSKIELDALSAGGIFKLVTAPQVPGDRWYSAILIRADGLRLITQRVRVIE